MTCGSPAQAFSTALAHMAAGTRVRSIVLNTSTVSQALMLRAQPLAWGHLPLTQRCTARGARLPWPSLDSKDTVSTSAAGAGEGNNAECGQSCAGSDCKKESRTQLGICVLTFAFPTGEFPKKGLRMWDLPTWRFSFSLQEASGFTPHLLWDVFYCPSTGQMRHLPINQQNLLMHVSGLVGWMSKRKSLHFHVLLCNEAPGTGREFKNPDGICSASPWSADVEAPSVETFLALSKCTHSYRLRACGSLRALHHNCPPYPAQGTTAPPRTTHSSASVRSPPSLRVSRTSPSVFQVAELPGFSDRYSQPIYLLCESKGVRGTSSHFLFL